MSRCCSCETASDVVSCRRAEQILLAQSLPFIPGPTGSPLQCTTACTRGRVCASVDKRAFVSCQWSEVPRGLLEGFARGHAPVTTVALFLTKKSHPHVLKTLQDIVPYIDIFWLLMCLWGMRDARALEAEISSKHPHNPSQRPNRGNLTLHLRTLHHTHRLRRGEKLPTSDMKLLSRLSKSTTERLRSRSKSKEGDGSGSGSGVKEDILQGMSCMRRHEAGTNECVHLCEYVCVERGNVCCCCMLLGSKLTTGNARHVKEGKVSACCNDGASSTQCH